ncbi:MAG TPA: hypothetical protein VGF63_03460 [Solirubrobacteraceae bacterium]|jgi:hypothetical protein
MLELAFAGGDRYVAGAYIVFLALILSYLAIMASKLSKIEREVVEISEIVERRAQGAEAVPPRSKEPVA